MIKGTITAKPQVFAAAVKWAAKFLDARPAAPIQAGLMLEADQGTLTVTSMNENVSAVASLGIEGDAQGRVVVSGRLLDQLVATFPNKPVELSGAEDTLTIGAGRWRGTLPTMDENDYPEVPGLPDVIGKVAGDALARMVAETAVATSGDPDKQTQWRSLHLTFGDGEIRAMGTDSYRAASSSVPISGDAVGDALVLAKPMVDVAASFIGPDDVQVGLSDSQLSLATGTRSVVLRLARVLGGEYPVAQVRELLAKEQPEHAVVKVANLAGPLKRAALVRDKDGPVAVAFAEGTLTIASKAEGLHQDGAEEVDVDYAGPQVVLHFNPKYFADALASAPGESVDMALTDKLGRGGRPGQVMLTVAGTPWRHALMPIKPIGA